MKPSIFANLDVPTYDPRKRCATPKHQIVPHAIVKAEKAKTKKQAGDDFRAAVWARDKGQSRASGKPLSKSGSDWKRVGEVHHVIPRSLAPERVLDVANGLLLSKEEHALAETACPNAPDKQLLDISGPDDRGQLQTFIWRDIQGKELRRRIG